MHDKSFDKVFETTPATTADQISQPSGTAINSLIDKFPLPSPAPDRRSAAILSAETIVRLAARFILRLIVAGEVGEFSAEDVRQNVPEFTEAYDRANIVGTMLGRGVHGKGLGLARGAGGRFLMSHENACRVVHRLDQEDIDATVEAMEITTDELTAAIKALPRFEKQTEL